MDIRLLYNDRESQFKFLEYKNFEYIKIYSKDRLQKNLENLSSVKYREKIK